MPSRPGRMRKFRIDEASFVDRPAQEPAVGLFMKRAATPNDGESVLSFVKRYPRGDGTQAQQIVEAMLVHEEASLGGGFEKYGDSVPVMTGTSEGHAHIVWLYGSRGGETTMQVSAGEENHHDHVWTIGPDGTLIIADNQGHGHLVDQTAVMAAMQELLLSEIVDAPDAVVDVVFAASAPEETIDPAALDLKTTVERLLDGTIVAKYSDGQPVPFGASLPDGSFPIRCSADLVTAIDLVGTDGDQPQAARHIMKRARVLGLEGELPPEGPLSIAQAGPAGDVTKNRPGGQHVSDKKTEGGLEALTKKVEELTAANVTLTANLDTVTKVAALSPDHRQFHDGLEGEAQGTFLSKSADDRQAQIDEITKGDPVEYTALDGTAYRKSDGVATLRLAKQVDEQARRLAKAEAEKATAEFEKRAESDLGNLPGSTAVRAEVLKAIEAIQDEDVRKGGLELLTAANTAMDERTLKRGVSTPPIPGNGSAEAQLNALAKSYAEEHEVDFYTAYDKVASTRPELAKAAIAGE